MRDCVIFAPRDLLPREWMCFGTPGPVRLFNPGLLREGSGWLFAYRVVGPDLLRRIGICRLDGRFSVIAGSQMPLSDDIVFAPERGYSERTTTWFADPRLYRFGQRIFLYWNSGWHYPQNHQFLQELDPATLKPMASPREFHLNGQKRIEKNWTLFGEDACYAVYSIAPQRILSFSLDGAGDMEFQEAVSLEWDQGEYGHELGGLRGGAPPQLVAGHYYSFCHSLFNSPDGFRYAPSVYRFSASWPFPPADAPAHDLPLSNPFGTPATREKLNSAAGEVIYPCGAAYEEHRWVISYGINDEYCAIACVTHAEVCDCFHHRLL